MNHIMIDIETLGTSIGSVIPSIGAVVFNEKEVLQELEINVNVESCLDAGLTIDAGTLIWWLKQNRDAIDATFMQDTMFIKQAISELSSFAAENMVQRYWSHGSSFDIVMMVNAARKLGVALDFPYQLVRDTRTLYELADVNPKNFFATGTTAHRAVDDARAQALAVIASWDKIAKWQTSLPEKVIRLSGEQMMDILDVAEKKEPSSDHVLEAVKSKLPDIEVPDFLKRKT